MSVTKNLSIVGYLYPAGPREDCTQYFTKLTLASMDMCLYYLRVNGLSGSRRSSSWVHVCGHGVCRLERNSLFYLLLFCTHHMIYIISQVHVLHWSCGRPVLIYLFLDRCHDWQREWLHYWPPLTECSREHYVHASCAMATYYSSEECISCPFSPSIIPINGGRGLFDHFPRPSFRCHILGKFGKLVLILLLIINNNNNA